MPAPAPPPPALTLTRFSSFTPDAIPRRDLKNAAYNPRRITDDARRRLKKNLETVGLVEPVIWNRRTGNVVGGHQRLRCLDSLEGSQDYLVPVAVVDLDPATEKSQCLFLNNQEAQGDWDLLLLADALKGIPELDPTGFDRGQLYQLFGCDPTLTTIAPEASRDRSPPPPPDTPEPSAEDLAAAIQKREAEAAAKKAAQDAEFRKYEQRAEGANEADFYLVVVFGSDAERKAFTEALQLPDNRYVDGAKLLERILSDS